MLLIYYLALAPLVKPPVPLAQEKVSWERTLGLVADQLELEEEQVNRRSGGQGTLKSTEPSPHPGF